MLQFCSVQHPQIDVAVGRDLFVNRDLAEHVTLCHLADRYPCAARALAKVVIALSEHRLACVTATTMALTNKTLSHHSVLVGLVPAFGESHPD